MAKNLTKACLRHAGVRRCRRKSAMLKLAYPDDIAAKV
jgi:hypothetical protein